jgi:hypothetical protein
LVASRQNNLTKPLRDAFTTAQLSNAVFAPQTVQDDADLLF